MLTLFAAGAPALAKPRFDQLQIRYGVMAEVSGAGCAPATLSRLSEGDDPVDFQPTVGQDVGFIDSVVVTSATLGNGQVSWTVHPTAEECAGYEGDPFLDLVHRRDRVGR